MEGDRLDDDQIALVIRRASELDGQLPVGQPGLDLVLLEEAAVEAGLSRESVRRAVAELRAGALPASDAETRRALLGPTVVTVSRCVPGPRTAVDDILRRFLRREQFRVRRDFGSSSTWVRRRDVPARVRVSLDRSVSHRLRLLEAEQVEIAVAEEPGDTGMVLVKVAVDARPLLRAHRAAIGGGAGLGAAAGAVAAALLGMPEALIVLPVAAASGAGAGHMIGASNYRSSLTDLETAIEGFLDDVEHR